MIFLADGLENEDVALDTYRIVAGQPLSAEVRCERRFRFVRGAWQVRVRTLSVMTATATHFLVTNELEAFEGEVRVFAKAWQFSTPRDHV